MGDLLWISWEKMTVSYQDCTLNLYPSITLRWCHPDICWPVYIDGSVQDCSNSSALAMESLQSCTKPSITKWTHMAWSQIGIRPSAPIMMTQLWLQCHMDHIMQYYITDIYWLTPGRCGSNFKSVIFEHIYVWIKYMSSHCEIALRRNNRIPLMISQYWFR